MNKKSKAARTGQQLLHPHREIVMNKIELIDISLLIKLLWIYLVHSRTTFSLFSINARVIVIGNASRCLPTHLQRHATPCQVENWPEGPFSGKIGAR